MVSTIIDYHNGIAYYNINILGTGMLSNHCWLDFFFFNPELCTELGTHEVFSVCPINKLNEHIKIHGAQAF